jgi:hypothetical protein
MKAKGNLTYSRRRIRKLVSSCMWCHVLWRRTQPIYLKRRYTYISLLDAKFRKIPVTIHQSTRCDILDDTNIHKDNGENIRYRNSFTVRWQCQYVLQNRVKVRAVVCVCVCVCVRARACVCMYVLCIYVCMYEYVRTYACIYVRKYVCIIVCMYVGMYVCTYVCMYICIYVRMYLCMYACIYVCMYVTIYSTFRSAFLCVCVCVFYSHRSCCDRLVTIKTTFQMKTAQFDRISGKGQEIATS